MLSKITMFFESTKNQQTTKAIVVGVSFVKVDYIKFIIDSIFIFLISHPII
jgi:hypothetical protein